MRRSKVTHCGDDLGLPATVPTLSIFVGCCALSVLVALVPLAFILFFVVTRGIQSLNLAFFTNMPRPVGEAGGGMANAIVGTLILTGLGSLMAIPIGIVSGIYMSEYSGTYFSSTVRFAADSGGSPTPVDVRITTVTIRAEGLGPARATPSTARWPY